MSLWRAWGKEGGGWCLWLSPCAVCCAGCVMWLCLYNSETNATTPWTFDSPGHDMEVAEVLYCLSPGTCSGDGAVLRNREMGGDGAATPCKPPRSCQQKCG